MAGPGSTVAPSYDPAKAVFYGQLVNAAYAMYDDHQSNPTPPPPKPPKTLPGNYRFVAWVQMRDFIFESGDWTFYGLIAQNPSGANDYVLAIRGTSDPTEWWDDLTSMVPWAWDAFGGDVGYGFFRIYETMRIIYPLKGLAPTEATPAGQGKSLEAAGTFADQVAEAVRRHAAESQPATAPAATALRSVTVAAHSLGGALATLYVADNSRTKKVTTPLLCTFASPRVGDYTFATTFDGLGIPSWRIVNELDIVPKLPIFPFWHIQTEHLYNSGSSTVWSLGCWHSIDTYLHLLDPKQPLLRSCVWPPPKVAAAAPLRAQTRPARVAAALTASADQDIAIAAPAGTTINITIKVG